MQPVNLDNLVLSRGSHRARLNGTCLLEAVAWWAGEPHGDHPACVSPVLAAMGRGLNDVLPDGRRQGLVRLIPAMPGTAGDGLDQARGYMATDWLARVYLPTWLDLAGLTNAVAALRDCPAVTSLATLTAVTPHLGLAKQAAAAAWAAAWDAAGDAAWDAAWDAAGAAAGAAAWAAAWDAARAAAWAAAGDVAGAAAGAVAWAAARDAARDAARAAAWAAARDAARDATGDATRDAAGDVAGDAARDALEPVVRTLQDSAASLLERMITATSS